MNETRSLCGLFHSDVCISVIFIRLLLFLACLGTCSGTCFFFTVASLTPTSGSATLLYFPQVHSSLVWRSNEFTSCTSLFLFLACRGCCDRKCGNGGSTN